MSPTSPMMTPTELRIRSDQYRQQLAQSIQSAKACRAPELAVLAEFVFAVVEIGGELCAQVAELREAIERAAQPRSM